ncbi:MAG: hypothetical protein JRI23_26250 [Deltaproteobacteria bacterium]|jgi:hypothetical protein|nr:hypothetical protein [Deltaproteobacteria bacterium]MBW2535534.1 hypothetical protein [Deltaproteobacteria bacterium]
MGDQATVWTALGATGESVMALYAVARLLKSRDLGPAQLLPAIESNRADAVKLGARLEELFVRLRAATAHSSDLQDALEVLEPYANDVAAQVAEAFRRNGPARLGASERLLLESRAEQLGAELEGIRLQLELVCAALHAQPVDLLLANVVDGRPGLAPTFVAREASVEVDLADDRGFSGDAQVLWSLIEAGLRQLSTTGDSFVLQAGTDGNGGLRLRIAPRATPPAGESDRRQLRLSLGASIRVEREVIAAVARYLGIGLQFADEAPAVTIAVK